MYKITRATRDVNILYRRKVWFPRQTSAHTSEMLVQKMCAWSCFHHFNVLCVFLLDLQHGAPAHAVTLQESYYASAKMLIR